MILECLKLLGNLTQITDDAYSAKLYSTNFFKAICNVWNLLLRNAEMCSGTEVFTTFADKEISWLLSNLTLKPEAFMGYSIIGFGDANQGEMHIIDHLQRIIRSRNLSNMKYAVLILYQIVNINFHLDTFMEKILHDNNLISTVVDVLDASVSNLNQTNLTTLITVNALKLLITIFKPEKLSGHPHWYDEFKRLGGVDILYVLQNHQSEAVYNLVSEIFLMSEDDHELDDSQNPQQ